MKLNKMTIAAIALSLNPAFSMAQNTESGYFMESYASRHEMNPAFDGDNNYFAFPALGNFNVAMGGDLRLDKVFYPRNGKLDLFTSSNISTTEALDGFKNDNRLQANVKMQILSAGFHAFGGFNTIGLNLRADGGVSLPYELFEIAKDLKNKDYSLDGINVMAQSYMELAFGHSRNVTENLRIGGKAKFLLGVGRMDAYTENFTLSLSSPDRWVAKGNVVVDAYLKDLKYESELKDYNDESHGQYKTVTDVDGAKASLSGFGLALDLGAEYDMGNIVEGLKVSAALLDLGFINWSSCMRAANDGTKAFEFKGFNNIKVNDGPGTDIEDQTNALGDDLIDLFNLQDKGDQGSASKGIGATLNVGAEYTLPTYNKLKFGVLSSTRFNDKYTWNNERISATWSPLGWFDASANYAIGTYGSSFGWMFNVHGNVCSMFFAMDHTMGKLAKQGFPLNSNADVSFGLTFNTGKSKAKKAIDENL